MTMMAAMTAAAVPPITAPISRSDRREPSLIGSTTVKRSLKTKATEEAPLHQQTSNTNKYKYKYNSYCAPYSLTDGALQKSRVSQLTRVSQP